RHEQRHQGGTRISDEPNPQLTQIATRQQGLRRHSGDLRDGLRMREQGSVFHRALRLGDGLAVNLRPDAHVDFTALARQGPAAQKSESCAARGVGGDRR
ncbi:MAG TPA: hypothetical protein VI485_03755, partial [Vicinamibacterales bacterium]|nr:hypothetical protein [Vicinamibacterales bacterium]